MTVADIVSLSLMLVAGGLAIAAMIVEHGTRKRLREFYRRMDSWQ